MTEPSSIPPAGRLLLVSLEPSSCRRMQAELEPVCQSVRVAQHEYEALQLISLSHCDIVLIGEYSRRIELDQTLRLIRKADPAIPLILLAHEPDRVRRQVKMLLGDRFDVLQDTTSPAAIVAYMQGMFAVDRSQMELLNLRRQLAEEFHLQELIGRCPVMQQVFAAIERVADSDASVLIQGDSGTGKELVAREIHRLSGRSGGPFITVNCAAIPENLLESELFGHEKGSFTGAVAQHSGKFEQADQGTLFLDEIGEMNLATQVKILRVLQEHTYQRVGGSETRRVSVRIITATNRNLEEEVKQGRFRDDLFYRIYVYPIYLPLLKERLEDIPLLVTHFIQQLASKNNRQVHSVTPGAMQRLQQHDWPGNVRELENVLERAVLLSTGPLMLPEHIQFGQSTGVSVTDVDTDAPSHEQPIAGVGQDGIAFGETVLPLEEIERRYLLHVLDQAGGNISKAAQLLQIGRATLYRKLEKYKIESS